MKLCHGYDRVDLIFDHYFDARLKAGTRNDGGIGSMFAFEGDDTPVPNDMEQTFMKESKNKNALNEYLAKKLIELHRGSPLLVATLKDTVVCSFDNETFQHSDISIIIIKISRCNDKQSTPHLRARGLEGLEPCSATLHLYNYVYKYVKYNNRIE